MNGWKAACSHLIFLFLLPLLFSLPDELFLNLLSNFIVDAFPDRTEGKKTLEFSHGELLKSATIAFNCCV